MKTATRFYSCLAAALLAVLASAGIAAAGAGSDTCVGTSATIGGTCTPVTNIVSGSNNNSAFGFVALESNTTGGNNTAAGTAALSSNTTGGDNTAAGFEALTNNTTGAANTAIGDSALVSNTTGSNNTAAGVETLQNNSTGGDNTAIGEQALFSNTTGDSNTATGEAALFGNTTGSVNTATGLDALENNTTGSDNTATGVDALSNNTTGAGNTAAGGGALGANTTGSLNTAAGMNALQFNTTGAENTATGAHALENNTTGGNNTAIGVEALDSSTTGNFNIGIGVSAGLNLTTGDNNIDIGNAGVAAESNTIRIGTQGTQTSTFIAGVFGTPKISKACPVVVENTGQIGCKKSSARYKRDIRDMGQASDGLMKLRPVSFLYKNDPDYTKQYGLVAEEVERVYPDLVVYGADGKVESVDYLSLIPMLLNELQKQARDNERKAEEIDRLSAQMAEMQASHERELGAMRTAFEERLSKLERTITSKDGNRTLAAAFNR